MAETNIIDFKIKRGLSTTLFSSPGIINKRLVVEEGCWYLCTDTADLFLGLKDIDGKLVLKRINDVEANSDVVIDAIETLQNKLLALESLPLYKKISDESELPTDFTSDDFNPNVTYYIPLENNKVSTYIFDSGAGCYLCTNCIDELVVRAMVSEAIELSLTDKFNTILPEAIKQTLKTTILHGGDATPED